MDKFLKKSESASEDDDSISSFGSMSSVDSDDMSSDKEVSRSGIVKVGGDKIEPVKVTKKKKSMKPGIDFGTDLLVNKNKVNLSEASSESLPGSSQERLNRINKSSASPSSSTRKSFKKSVEPGDEDDDEFPASDEEDGELDDESFDEDIEDVDDVEDEDIEDEEDEEDDDEARKMSRDEIVAEKQRYLVVLRRLENKGYIPPRKYTMADKLSEIKSVADSLTDEKEKDSSIKTQRKILLGFTSIAEYLNKVYNPFDLHLNGWSESVFESLSEYDEVFEELYDKYKESISMSPEVKLIGMVASSAMMFHFTKSLFDKTSQSVPEFEDVMNNNPELKRQYRDAAANMYNQSGSNQVPVNNGGASSSMGGLGMFANMFSGAGGDGGNPLSMLSGLMGGMGGGNQKRNEQPAVAKPINMEAPDDVEDLLEGFNKPNRLDISNEDNYSDVTSDTDISELKNIKIVQKGGKQKKGVINLD